VFKLELDDFNSEQRSILKKILNEDGEVDLATLTK